MFHLPSPTAPDFGKTLSHLWIFAILNILFRDIHEVAKASTLNDLLNGVMNGNPVTDGALLAGAFAVQILLLAALLSALLPMRAVQRLNIVAAPLAASGFLLAPPTDPDDVVFIAVVLITFGVIFVASWRWHPAGTATQQDEAAHVL